MRKNVASQVVGAQINSKTDGSAVTTGTTTVYVTGDGGTQAAGSVGSGACTHEGHGFWTYAPAQAETNYDHVAFTFENSSGVNATVQIYPGFPQTGDNYARLGAPAGASVSADVAAVKAVLPAALVSGRIDASVGAMASGVLTATAIAADAITDAKVASDVTIASVTGAVGSVTGAVGSVTGAVGSVTGNVGGNVVGSVASVTARVTANTDQLAGQTVTAGAGVTFPSSVASPTNITAASGVALTSAYDPAKTASQAGDAMTLTSGERTSIAAAIWNALTSGLTTVGSIGKLLVDNVNATISSRLPTSSYAAPLDAAGTRSAVGLATANLDTQLAALPTAAENADAVWEEAIADHDGTAGSTAEALSNATSGGGASAADIADAVWDETLADHQGSGSTGEALNGAGAAGNPWIAVGEGVYSTLDLLRMMAAVLLGKTSVAKHGTNDATVTFRDVSDSSDIVVAEMHKSNRNSVALNP